MNDWILTSVPAVLAQTVDAPWNWRVDALLRSLLAVCIFSVVGVAVLTVCIWLMCKLVPFSIQKEIAEDHNVALGIVMGAIILGISIIIAASVVG